MSDGAAYFDIIEYVTIIKDYLIYDVYYDVFYLIFKMYIRIAEFSKSSGAFSYWSV